MRVLDALAARNVRATFFVLGLAAEMAPQLVKRIVAAGHEIQSHGYGHRSNFDGVDVEADLRRVSECIEDAERAAPAAVTP